MGLLDRITSSIRSTVSSAVDTVEKAVEPVAAKATSVVKEADSYVGVVKDKAKDLAPQAPSQHWYSGIADAFEHTELAVQNTVGSAVRQAEVSMGSAAHAVADAGHAVTRAGQQVVESGAAVVKAGVKAGGDLVHIAEDAGRVVGDAGQVVADAGRAAYHAGNAALTGNPGELDAAAAAVRSARADVADAHRAVADAHDRAVDLGTEGKHVVTALKAARTSLENAGDALSTAGHSIGDAARTVASTPRQVLTGVASALAQGGKEAEAAFERDVPGGKAMVQGIEHYAGGARQVAEGLVFADPFRVAKGLRDEASGLVDFGKGAWKAGAPVVDYAKNKIVDYAQGFNAEKQIATLKPGESYELRAGANVHVELGAEAEGKLAVTANQNGTFTVTAGGAMGLNGYLEAGGRVKLGVVNGSAGGELSAHLTAGGELELECANAAEAQRAAGIMEKLAAAANPAGLILSGGHPISKDDAEFLKKHTKSIELSGELAGEAFGALGLDKGVLKAGIGGSLRLGAKPAVKIELEDGKPTGVVLKTEFKGEVEAHGGLGLTLPKGAPEKGGGAKAEHGAKGEEEGGDWSEMPKGSFSGRVEDTLTVETHYDLPKNMSLAEFQKDPIGTLKKYGAEMNKSATSKATLEALGEGQLGSKQANIKAELSFSGKPSEVLNAEAIDKAMRGDYAGAARAAGDKVEVEGSLGTYSLKKWGFEDLGGDIFGVGLEGTFQATREHDDPPSVKYKMSGTEYVTNVAKGLESFKPRGSIRG